MNFIMKFLDKTTSYANKYAVQREIDKLRGTILHLQTSLGEVEDALNERILAFENKTTKPIMSTTDAILDVLKKQTGEKLHYSVVYNIIKQYNLIKPDVSIQSVRATLYQLARQKRIVLDNGAETGMFFIKE